MREGRCRGGEQEDGGKGEALHVDDPFLGLSGVPGWVTPRSPASVRRFRLPGNVPQRHPRRISRGICRTAPVAGFVDHVHALSRQSAYNMAVRLFRLLCGRMYRDLLGVWARSVSLHRVPKLEDGSVCAPDMSRLLIPATASRWSACCPIPFCCRRFCGRSTSPPARANLAKKGGETHVGDDRTAGLVGGACRRPGGGRLRRPAADTGRALVLPASRQPRHRGAQHPPATEDQALRPDPPPGADRPRRA